MLAMALPDIILALVDAIPDIINTLIDVFIENLPMFFKNWCVNCFGYSRRVSKYYY